MPKIYGYTEILGDVLITGSFSILGSASTINSTNLTVDDSIIVLAHGQTGSPVLDAGIFFVRGTGATQAFIWDESVDEFALVQTSDDHTVIGNINITGYSNLRLGNIGIGGAPSANTTAYIKGSDSSSGTYSLKIDDVNSNPILYVRNDKQIYISGNVAQNSGGSVDIGYYQIIPSGYSYGMLVSGSPLYGNYAATGNTSRTHFYSSESQKTAYEADMAASVSSAYRIGFGASIVGVNSTGYNIAFNANVINGTSGNYTIYSTNGDSFFNNTSMRLQGRTNGTDSILSLWNLIGDSILYVRNDGNVGIGTTSPTSKLHIKGSGTSSGTYSLKIDDVSNNNLFSILDNGQVNFNTTVDTWGTYNFTSTGGNVISVSSLSSGSYAGILFSTEGSARFFIDTNATGTRIRTQGNTNMYLARGVAEQEVLSFGPNYIQMEAPVGVGIGKYGPSVSARLHIQGSGTSSGTYSLKIDDGSGNPLLYVRNDGYVGIGKTSPSYPLHVVGTVSSDTGYNIGATAGFTGTGAYTNFTIVGGIIVSAS